MISKNQKALFVILRNPVYGKVKTRIAVSRGDQFALNLYNFLLNHTARVIEPLNYDINLFYSDFIEDIQYFNFPHKKFLQQGDNLGQRIFNAFDKMFSLGYGAVIMICSDSYEISTGIINLAFEKINEHDCVIGPAYDGGYYLMGLKQQNERIFMNMPWSTSEVYEKTFADLKLQGKSVYSLPMLHDIDIMEDVYNSGLNPDSIIQ